MNHDYRPFPVAETSATPDEIRPRLRVAIADDHALFRQGLKALLRLEPDVLVVAEVERADTMLPTLERTPCDILLLDLQMDRSTFADIEELAERTAVVVVTASERMEDAVAAMRAGARGFLFKRFALETMMTAIRAVHDGHVWLPPELQSEMAAGFRSSPGGLSLTRREREIVRHVALGLRNREVAEKLYVREGTVKTHLNNIFQKLGVRDRVELALHAVRKGIIGANERPRPTLPSSRPGGSALPALRPPGAPSGNHADETGLKTWW